MPERLGLLRLRYWPHKVLSSHNRIGGRENDVYFLAFSFDSDLMVGFVGGDFSWELSTAGEEAAIDFAAQSLERIFGSSIREKIGRGSLTPWGADRWSRGAYSGSPDCR